MLSFQKLDVYRCAIEFLARSTSPPQNQPRGHFALAEQLRRAALSIPLNIAEAAGRVSEADGARHDAAAFFSARSRSAAMSADFDEAIGRTLFVRIVRVEVDEQVGGDEVLLARLIPCRPRLMSIVNKEFASSV